MTALNIALVQKASGLDPQQNREQLGFTMDALGAAHAEDSLGLVLFPEAYACDFGPPGTDISEHAEDLDGPFVKSMTFYADEYAGTLVAGMFERSGDPARPYNTLVVAGREGVEATYRKIHLYDSFGYKESDRLLAGDLEPVLVDVGGIRVGLMTCYDLRFPELARQLVTRGAELLVVPAAWVAGDRKVDHWRTLVKARAIENTVYVAAAAQPGPRYCGHSMIVDPFGDVLVEAADGEETVEATVERRVVEKARSQNPSLANRRL
ncbi:MAG TPA: carbon-nitrogen hydrolase family protein [Nocardioidaceae bacterium]|nr:carbon-nitrogen hydrolase family protein [Nocardioidaceae bacterium]